MNGRRNGFFEERMQFKDMMLIMTGGDNDAIDCLSELKLSDIHYLNELGLDGSMIATLWTEACGCDIDRLQETIEAFKAGRYTKEQIQKNLKSWNVKPFV